MLSEQKRRATGGFCFIFKLFQFSYLRGDSCTFFVGIQLYLFSLVARKFAHHLLFPQHRTQCVFFRYLFRLRKREFEILSCISQASQSSFEGNCSKKTIHLILQYFIMVLYSRGYSANQLFLFQLKSQCSDLPPEWRKGTGREECAWPSVAK